MESPGINSLDAVIDLDQCAKLLKFSPDYVYRLACERKIPCVPMEAARPSLGGKKQKVRYRFLTKAILEYMEKKMLEPLE